MVQHVDMTGKVVLITGATNGIGRVTAVELAKMGAEVVIVGRNRTRIDATLQAVKEVSKGQAIDSMLADLSSMDEVRRLAESFKSRYNRLDVLVNNAGALFPERKQSVDGYEMSFALNHLNYFLLTHLLLDALKDSAPARIVNVSSDAHRNPRGINFDDLQTHSYGMAGIRAYSQSKLANVLFTYELAKRLSGTQVTANALHPGFVASGFGRGDSGILSTLLGVVQRFAAISAEEGAETMLYLATSPEVEGVTGKYFEKCKPIRSSDASYDEDAARRLWEVSEELVAQKASV